jgi:hypothetical protein
MRSAELTKLAEPKAAVIWGRVFFVPDDQGIEQSAFRCKGTLYETVAIFE